MQNEAVDRRPDRDTSAQHETARYDLESSNERGIRLALQHSELRFRALFENAGDAILLVHDGRFVDCNARTLDIFGCTRERIIGAPPYEFSPPQQPDGRASDEKAREKILLALSEGPQFFEWQHCRADRSPFTAEVSLNRLDLGDQVLLQAIVRDVTERKRANELLQQSEATLRSVFAAAPIGICIMKNRVFERCNQFWYDTFGYEQGSLVGKSTRLLYESDQEWLRIGQALYTDNRDTRKASVTTRFLTGQGTLRDVVLTVAPIQGDDPSVGVVAIVHDVTERLQAEGRARRVNLLYATLSRLNQSVVRAANRQSLFENACRVAVEHGQFRLAWVGMIDETDHRVKPVAFAGQEQGYLEQLSIAYLDPQLGRGPTGTAIREGCCVICQDVSIDPRMGVWREAALKRGFRSSAAVPIKQGANVVGAISVYAGDVGQFDEEQEGLLVEMGSAISYALDALEHDAARRQAELDLQQLNQELERRVKERTQALDLANAQLLAKNQELKEFAYSVSHDLKAPLRGIAGYANELERKHRDNLSERAKFCLSQILTATSHLDQLIEDLLHYSRLDAETPTLSDVFLPALIRSILRDRDLVIAEHGVEVTVELQVETLHVWERGLAQVLTNLIDNAIKYSRQSKPPRLSIGAESETACWRLTVSDNGIGFDTKYHDRIFGLFNRLVRMEDYEGTGAGLAIVKKVLDKQGGRIWADSAPGRGATFFVELPRPELATSVGRHNA